MKKSEMKMFEVIEKTREYLNYLEEHILNVEKAWKEIQEKCKDMFFIYDDFVFYQLDNEIKRHDMSKMSKFEFVQYRKKFYPCDNEEPYNIAEAWYHHKNNNPHHWENWTTKFIMTTPYDLKIHCVHMVIDWIAMSYKFGDTAQVYYENMKDEIHLPEWAVEFIYEIFNRLYPEMKGE